VNIWPFKRPAYSVLIVCTANVCRSPAAEALLRHHLKQMGMARRIQVRSAGTDVAAPGRGPDPRVVAMLKDLDVSARGIRAEAVSARSVASASRIYVMEQAHRDKLLEAFPEISGIHPLDPSGADLPDPYFGSKSDVRDSVATIGDHARLIAEDLVRCLHAESMEEAPLTEQQNANKP